MADWADEIGFGELARNVAAELGRRRWRLVLAESCSGGLAAAALASVSGISEYFCGSAVTYREQTKMDWLGVPSTTIARDSAVSVEATREMARGALLRTPEADWSAAITGHLGPNAPPGRDGEVFVSIAKRDGRHAVHVQDAHFRLQDASRPMRQVEACRLMLTELLRCLRQGLNAGIPAKGGNLIPKLASSGSSPSMEDGFRVSARNDARNSLGSRAAGWLKKQKTAERSAAICGLNIDWLIRSTAKCNSS